MLPSAIAGSAYVIGGYYQHLGGVWSQHYTQSTAASQWVNLEEYSLTEGDFDNQFSSLYSDALEDYEYIRVETQKEGDWSYYMIATLMQAYTFQVLADLYGDIPFSEALRGVNVLTPKWETGQAVYDSLLMRIDDAVSKDFSLSSVSKVGYSDIIFGGVPDKEADLDDQLNDWFKFANTLKLKIYMRYVNVDPEKYRSQIVALLAENNFLTKDAKMIAFKNEEDNRNPFYETFIDRLSGNVAASATLLDTLRKSQDPRLDALFNTPELGGGHVAIPQGFYKEAQTQYASYKNLSLPNFNPTAPVYFFTLPEVNFLIAEAQLRYGTEAMAIQYYQMGIDESFKLLGLTPDPTLYQAGGVYEYKGLESIITQKWIAAANTNAIESFFDYNRTGYPDFFDVSPVSTIGEQRPQRLLYPDSERKSNPNTPPLKRIYEKVWWAL
ncbi:MAG: SusD/RagB family nutrient-binding outer membrane lipoprotein [Bacteroidales bacterium]|nr:SusD/RagB family nutrient-binding outer membrane lipoprotein [Bacteroidales bacterium]